MKIALAILLGVHGIIHVLGISRAVKTVSADENARRFTLLMIFTWRAVGGLFLLAAIFFLFSVSLWWIPLSVAVIISQYLIFQSWTIAKYGTLLNIILICMSVLGFAQWNYYRQYRSDVKLALESCSPVQAPMLTEADLENLPYAIQKYIRVSGSLNKPKVCAFKVVFTGQIRDYDKKEWMPMSTEQYNIINTTTRLFFLNATMKSMPVAGYHSFRNGAAWMDIRAFSLFTVQYQSGEQMNQSETVTFFNDMCVMAPATLIDHRIKWTEIDSVHADASFTSNDITVHASLFFNEKGQLVNFVSPDRYALTNGVMKMIPWSTPVSSYGIYDGYTLSADARAVYSYPEGNFSYGEFHTVAVEYNPVQ